MTKSERADRANRILQDEMFVEAFENTRQAIFSQIERTPIRDDEGLKHLRLCLKLLTDVRANLVAVLNDGKLDEFRMEQTKNIPNLRDFKR